MESLKKKDFDKSFAHYDFKMLCWEDRKPALCKEKITLGKSSFALNPGFTAKTVLIGTGKAAVDTTFSVSFKK